jgi:hypothetical protein
MYPTFDVTANCPGDLPATAPSASRCVLAGCQCVLAAHPLWLHGKSGHSQVAYLRHAESLLTFTAKPLQTITLADLQQFADNLTGS